ncbi:MRG/MORF4L-binding protein-like isoform X2 [Liolophura sinensis]
MVFIHEKLNSSLSKKIASQQIWTQLTKMYDLQALNESEIIPFPNKKTDFSLPEGDFGDLMSKDYPRMSKNALGPATDSAKQELAPPTPKQGGKGGNQSGSASTLGAGSLNTNTPEASPKRKRTRNTQSTPSSANSTPDAPPTKRRR